MAHIIGYKQGSTRKIPVTHAFLIAIVAFSLIGFMLVSEENWQDHLLSLVGTVSVILVLVGFALNKMNPMGWKQLFQKTEHERDLQGEQKIVEALQTLDNEYTILCGFTFELIYVQFFILGQRGIFVVGKTTTSEPLGVENGMLMANKESLAKLTGNLWRLSHLANLVIKKGYNLEIVPKPILVTTHLHATDLDDFDGISIVKPEELASAVEEHSTMDIPPEVARGFTAYLHQRYFK